MKDKISGVVAFLCLFAATSHANPADPIAFSKDYAQNDYIICAK